MLLELITHDEVGRPPSPLAVSTMQSRRASDVAIEVRPESLDPPKGGISPGHQSLRETDEFLLGD